VCVCVCARIALRTKTLIPRSVVKLQLPPVHLIASVSLSLVAYIGALMSMSWLHSWRMAYRGADKYLARPGRKQARKRVRDASDFNNIETRVVNKFFSPLQGKATKEIDTILTETLACFLPGRAKDLSAPPVYFTL